VGEALDETCQWNGQVHERWMEKTTVHTASSARKGEGETNGHQPIEQHPMAIIGPPRKAPVPEREWE